MITNIDELANAVHDNAVRHGFHPDTELVQTFVANQCNNLHGEVTELWDAWRAGKQDEQCDKDIGLTCTEEELADLVIRALDVSRRLSIDIVYAVNVKHEYDRTRQFKHGKLN
jgi:NTP pyrophosphatase (non-canonical NTP hydrolase)